jgi:hypothetical protein
MLLMGGLPLRFGFWWGLCCYLTAGKYPASLSLLRIQHLESGFIVATHNSVGPYGAGGPESIVCLRMARIPLLAFLTYEFRGCYPAWNKLSIRRHPCRANGFMGSCLPGARRNSLGRRNDPGRVSENHSEAAAIPVF